MAVRSSPPHQTVPAVALKAIVGQPFPIRLKADTPAGREWHSIFSAGEFAHGGCDTFPKVRDAESQKITQVFWFTPKSQGTFQIKMEHKGADGKIVETKSFQVTASNK